MNNTIIREFIFNVGWKKAARIKLFDNNFEITIKLQAYFEKDGITSEQENSYIEYKKNEVNLCKTMEQLMENFDANAFLRFTPSTLIFERDGSYALLCDDKLEPDDGIAVCLEPTKKVVYQDDYL